MTDERRLVSDIERIFDEVMRQHVALPEEGADGVDAAIGSAIIDARERVLAALPQAPQPIRWRATCVCGAHYNRPAQPSAEPLTTAEKVRLLQGEAAQPSAEVERLRRLLIYLWDAELDDKFVVSDNFEPGDPLYEDVERERAALAGTDRP